MLTTVFVQAAMDTLMLPYGVPTLTAPFCITTWLFLLPRYVLDGQMTPDHTEWVDDLKGPEK